MEMQSENLPINKAQVTTVKGNAKTKSKERKKIANNGDLPLRGISINKTNNHIHA